MGLLMETLTVKEKRRSECKTKKVIDINAPVTCFLPKSVPFKYGTLWKMSLYCYGIFKCLTIGIRHIFHQP
jgi:hypothetical protein